MKTVGVLAYDGRRFLDAIVDLVGFAQVQKILVGQQEVRTKDTRYVYCRDLRAMRGMRFDAVLLLQDFDLARDWHERLEYARFVNRR